MAEEEEEEDHPLEQKLLSTEVESLDLVLKGQLEALMEQEKPYLNPRLTLSDLASLLGTNIHQLSKLINEGFDKNFFDFINSYRVREFQRRAVLPEYKNQTLLAIAFSVGFNSKTAFNRSFKKLTKKTPRQYLKSHEKPDGHSPLAVES